MDNYSNTNKKINYNPLVLKPSKLRRTLFPIKILSLISLLVTPAFFFISTFSDVLSKLNKDLLFILKIGLFLSFCLLNILCKLTQAKITYNEIKRMYCENDFSIKTYEYTQTNDGQQKKELKIINIPKPKTSDFPQDTKSKYKLAVAISVLTSIFFVIPYVTLAILEKFKVITQDNLDIFKSFSNIFYTLCFSVLILTFFTMHSVETSMMIKKEYWEPLDNSPKNQRLGVICGFAILHQAIDFIAYRVLNSEFLKKYENKKNGEKDVPDHISGIMNKNFFLSNALFFSNGESVNDRFGLVEILGENSKHPRSKPRGNENMPVAC